MEEKDYKLLITWAKFSAESAAERIAEDPKIQPLLLFVKGLAKGETFCAMLTLAGMIGYSGVDCYILANFLIAKIQEGK